jgi:hypothetical protein
MSEPATLQHALRRFGCPEGLDAQRRKVRHHLSVCRTEAMGGLQLQCERCEQEQPRYHSCRNRHCPQCQGRAAQAWAERARAQLLPVRYYHVVFTLPHRLNAWVQLHPEVIYRLRFAAAWATLKAFGQDPKRLGGEMGMTAVLHTWGQQLNQHVHLHCLVPGGALSNEGQWRAARSNYLFPVKALSRHVRGRMVGLLRCAAQAGELHRCTHPGEMDAVLDALMGKDWSVYSKSCLEHSARVVEYLARYTHRIAITNRRILSVDERHVSLRYQDNRDGKHRTLQLEGEEFVRRFMLHVLPKGLMRVRHFGFLANRSRREKLSRIRTALRRPPPRPSPSTETTVPAPPPCPRCRQGRLLVIAQLPPRRSVARPPARRR